MKNMEEDKRKQKLDGFMGDTYGRKQFKEYLDIVKVKMKEKIKFEVEESLKT